MTVRTVPFNYSLFYNAMIALIGREPDSSHRFGLDGTYMFRYQPKDDTEAEKLEKCEGTLQEWLAMFELIPLHSRCQFGRLPRPTQSENGKDYLNIVIVHPVEKKEKLV